jgi:uncharacterized protein (DUF58 family)
MAARSATGTGGQSGLLAGIERQAGLTASGLIVGGLAAGGWLLARALGGRAVYLLAYCAAGLLIASVAMARRRRPVQATRSQVVRRAREGQSLEVALTVAARSRVTTFRIEEQLHPHLGPSVVIPIGAIAAGEEKEFRYNFTPRLRGVYSVGPLVAEFSDPLGLARRRQQLIGEAEVIVHPHTDEVLDRPLTRAFEDPPLRPPNSRAWPQGFEFYGMREYVRGDDTRRVVWRAFARTERLLVRQFEQGISDRITIVVDSDREWHSPGVPSDTFETAVRVAASVGVRHIKDGFTVALHAGYSELGRGFRGPRSRLPFLDELARLHLSREPLCEAMARLARGTRRDSHIVLVTSHLDGQSTAAANVMAREGASFTVVAIIWEEGDAFTVRRAAEIGAQVVKIKPGAGLGPVFRSSLQRNINTGARP